MTEDRTAAAPIDALDVYLQDQLVGHLHRSPGDFISFALSERFRAQGGRPVLSLSLFAAQGGLRRDPRPLQGSLPPFFANLLPEDLLREAMERHHAGQVRRGNDFDLLAALGADLPGAVRVLPTAQTAPPLAPPAPRPGRARFSLAGVQMKLSIMKGKERGFTLPLADEDGQFIAKFPSLALPGLSENEFACLSLAKAVGLDVPECSLVERAEFRDIPEEFETLIEGKVLLVRRFDRTEAGERIHIEDFSQVFGLAPARKYDGAAYHDIAAVLNMAVSLDSALDFVRRLCFALMTGNGDMHLKNWSLIYRGDGTRPALAPVYDQLSTVPYLPGEGLALSLAGTQSFKAVTEHRWKVFAHRARLPEAAVLRVVAEMANRIVQSWPHLPARHVVPPAVLARIDRHVAQMGKLFLPEV